MHDTVQPPPWSAAHGSRGGGAGGRARTHDGVQVHARRALAEPEVGDGGVAADAPRGRIVRQRRLLRRVERAQPQARALRRRDLGLRLGCGIALRLTGGLCCTRWARVCVPLDNGERRGMTSHACVQLFAG